MGENKPRKPFKKGGDLDVNKFVKKYTTEIVIGLLAFFIGSASCVWVFEKGLIRVLVDQNSHLNLTRQAVDSLTPGISQIGFWPPLLHVLMVPFIIPDTLYRSGLSGAFVLIPLLVIASIFIYKIVYLFTLNRVLAFAASLIFFLNPYVLYYSVTPMMEVLFIANVLGITYFLSKWIQKDNLVDLLLTGIFVALATVSRFEGLILFPLTSVIILISLILKRTNYWKLESLLILYSLLAVSGLCSIFVYGIVYGSNPLSFLKSDWASSNIVGSLYHPTKHDLLLTLKYFYFSLSTMLSHFLVITPLILSPIVLFRKNIYALISALLVLSSPFIFDFYAVFNGNAVIYIPNLPPFDRVLNVRYGMYNIGFFIVLLFVIIGTVLNKLMLSKKGSKKIIGYSILSLLLVPIITNSLAFIKNTAINNNFYLVNLEAKDYPADEQREAAKILNQNYDFGKILITRGLNDFVVVDSNISLKNFIIESNYKYYNQAIERPWLFARWIVTFNPNAWDTNNWSYKTEKISQKWTSSELFQKNYKLIYENPRQRIYKINEASIQMYANDRGYDFKKIPSVNNVSKWNPDLIYDQLKSTYEHSIKLSIQDQIYTYYKNKLLPLYKSGYYVDQNNKGTSESQSYALLQSLYSNDMTTFDKVWKWTKSNIQNEDFLFAWEFSVIPKQNEFKILDKNSATDADIDIAYALLLAYERWGNKTYRNDALDILESLKKYEIVEFDNTLFVTAGNWADSKDKIVINPSYLSPAAFSLFSKYDGEYWLKVKSDSYQVISENSEYSFQKNKLYLPTNWIVFNKSKLVYEPYTDKEKADNFSDDAFRLIPKIIIDYKTNNDNQAIGYLSRTTAFNDAYSYKMQLCSEFNGNIEKCTYSIAGLSAPLLIFSINSPDLEEKILNEHYLSNNKLREFDNISFYNLSWYWFGLYYWLTLN